jgi:hypothetical protein
MEETGYNKMDDAGVREDVDLCVDSWRPAAIPLRGKKRMARRWFCASLTELGMTVLRQVHRWGKEIETTI